MRIDVTVVADGRERDLAIESREPIPLDHVWSELASAAGLDPTGRLWRGDAPMRTSAVLGKDLRSGAVLSTRGPAAPSRSPSLLVLQQSAGPGAGRARGLEQGALLIGRGADCDLVTDDADASRRHALVTVTHADVTVADLGSTNGTFVDGRAIAEPTPLRVGQLLRLGDCVFTLTRPDELPAVVRDGDDGTLQLRQATREGAAWLGALIDMPARGTLTRPSRIQWTAALLPAVAGAAVAYLAQSPQFLLFAVLSPAMLLSSSLGDRLHWRRSNRRAATAARHSRGDAQRQIAEALARETAWRRRAHPDPAAIGRAAMLPARRLWERRPADDDFSTVRLGVADQLSATLIREGTHVRSAGIVRGVPATVDLRAGPLGIAGPADVVSGVGHWIAAQLAAACSPTDLELVLFADEAVEAGWRWLRWCPHLRRRPAVTPQRQRELADELVSLADVRSRARQAGEWAGPWLVVIADQVSECHALATLNALSSRGARVGIVAVILEGELAALPSGCRSIARVDGVTGSRAELRATSEQGCRRPLESADPHDEGARRQSAVEGLVLDRVDGDWAHQLGRALAPLAAGDPTGAAAVPATCDLLDAIGLCGVAGPDQQEVSRRWQLGDTGARAALGGRDDGTVVLDLATHGPHVLVAGTTGAGKSELLQTLVVGLAVNHPPDALNVVLVDYKGGAAFAECAELPHCAGLVTDLDGYQTERALRSLRAELRRRERLFREVRVSGLDDYRAAGGADVARLVLVVDEFASLAEELPQFVSGLVSVAQRGRSLGVHLVLATQRPGAAVSAEIRANTGVRIALRTTSAAESADIIDTPEAAALDRAIPGRAFIRIGSELTCFQAAHPGASAPGPRQARVAALDEWRRPAQPAVRTGPGHTQLGVAVAAVRAAADSVGRAAVSSPWLPALPTLVPSSALTTRTETQVPVALVDLPDERRREQLTLDLEAPSALLAVGSHRSGRTTLLCSLALGAASALGPDSLELHVVDGTGELADRLSGLPHVGSVLGLDAAHMVPRLLGRIAARATPSATTSTLVLIDGWDAMCASLGDDEALQCADALAAALRNRGSSRLTAAVTGDRALLAPRLAGLFDTRLLLRLADRGDYALAGVPLRDLPTQLPPGRGVRAPDGAVLQVVWPGDPRAATADTKGTTDTTDCAAIADVRRIVAGLDERWRHVRQPPHVIRVRPLPTAVRLTDVPARAGRIALGIGGDSATPISADLFGGERRMLVAGPTRSGRSTLLVTVMAQALAARKQVVVAAPRRSPLREAALRAGVCVLGPDCHDVDLPETRSGPAMLLVDDAETLTGRPLEDALSAWLDDTRDLAAVLAGRVEDLATSYRGLGALFRRSQCGVLLRPGPVDGDVLGVRLPRRARGDEPPGRGLLVADPGWGSEFADTAPIAIQLARP